MYDASLTGQSKPLMTHTMWIFFEFLFRKKNLHNFIQNQSEKNWALLVC